MAEIIDWNRLPNIPRIMSEFADGNHDVFALLGGDYRDADVRRAAAERRKQWEIQPGLGDALRAGYNGLTISAKVAKNLEALNHQGTLAVVTGQQIGIFGGPLYTFYKALHTILLAEKLSRNSSGIVVPLFWMETADADFGEVNRIAFPSIAGEARRAIYAPRDFVAGRSVSLHELTPEIDAVRGEVVSWLEDLPHGKSVIDLIERAYSPGRLISDAFKKLMNELLGDLGLVMVDARHPAMVPRGLPFWKRTLRNPEKLNDPFVLVSREMERIRLPLQVQLRRDALPILAIGEDGVRRRVLGKQGAWRIGSDGKILSDSDLALLTLSMHESLTPSALLRPLYQDWILPTWIYVGGPSEVSYHAQIGRAYDYLEIPRPLVAPRMSLTLVERAARRSLDKHGWTVSDVIGGREILLSKSGKADALEGVFESGADHLQSWLKRIERAGDEAGITLYDEIDQAGRKIEHQWNRVRSIAVHKVAEQDKSRVLHAERLLDKIMPDEILQERQTSLLYFLGTYNRDLITVISREVDLFSAKHLAIDLGGNE